MRKDFYFNEYKEEYKRVENPLFSSQTPEGVIWKNSDEDFLKQVNIKSIKVYLDECNDLYIEGEFNESPSYDIITSYVKYEKMGVSVGDWIAINEYKKEDCSFCCEFTESLVNWYNSNYQQPIDYTGLCMEYIGDNKFNYRFSNSGVGRVKKNV